jgi:hypothetical protein
MKREIIIDIRGSLQMLQGTQQVKYGISSYGGEDAFGTGIGSSNNGINTSYLNVLEHKS